METGLFSNNDPSEEEFNFLEFVRSPEGEHILRDSGYIPLK